ncbi:DMT family transporter [Candidatus Deferrimicrobium sp.]|uniref:DMT family transporter n=1 Tax=Candidatus Deferrimicrobium sp. TaxID=3060586 RepID=UPI003C687286
MTEPVSEHRKALVYLVLASLGWSLGGLLIKGIAWNPMAISGMRSLIGVILIRVWFRRMRFTWSLYQVGGAVAYAGTVILFVLANKMTTAANAILLQYTAPVYVALLSPWFLGEPARRRDWVTIVVVLGGMVLFFLDQLTPAGFWGNVVALGSGVCFGGLTLFLRRQKTVSTIESLYLGNLLAAAAGLPFMFGSMPDAQSCVGLLLLGVAQLGIPYILYSMAVRHVTAVTAILVPMIEPVLNPVWVFIALGEVPGPMSILGGLVILGSVFTRAVFSSLRKKPVSDSLSP